ncbi:MAG: DUF1501 domain-containing protein [Bdellovibrionales bacterium]
MNWITRRDFLKYSAGLSALSLCPQMATAANQGSLNPVDIDQLNFQKTKSQNSQFVILVSFAGGWDTSLGPDAWTSKIRPPESEYFIEYREDQLLPFGESFVGPGMAPFSSYFKNLTIFNGVYLSSTDLGHPLLRYSETGQGQGELAVLPAQFSEATQNFGLGLLSSRSAYVAGKSLPQIDTSGLSTANLTAALTFDLATKASTDILESQKQIRALQAQIQNYNSALTQSRTKNSGLASMGQIIGQAFKQGLSFGAAVDVEDLRDTNNQNIDFDTHSNHERQHLESLRVSFENLKKLMDELASIEISNGVSVLSKTTIVIVSDFTRTPAKNASGGKDHNPQTSSMLVWNQNWKGSQILGASRHVGLKNSRVGIPYLSALPLDIRTKKPVLRREDVFILRPDHVMATIYQSMGIEAELVHPGFRGLPKLDLFF